jgi:hypothetical protein
MKKVTLAVAVLLVLVIGPPLVGHAGKTRVFVSGSFWAGPPAYWGPPHFGPPCGYGHPVVARPWPPPVYCAPYPLVAPPVYVQRGQEESDYWYYCDNPPGFYPYIKSCPGGWMKVVPETVPPDR